MYTQALTYTHRARYVLALCSRVYAIINALVLMLRDTKRGRQSGTGRRAGRSKGESRLGPRTGKEIYLRLARATTYGDLSD